MYQYLPHNFRGIFRESEQGNTEIIEEFTSNEGLAGVESLRAG